MGKVRPPSCSNKKNHRVSFAAKTHIRLFDTDTSLAAPQSPSADHDVSLDSPITFSKMPDLQSTGYVFYIQLSSFEFPDAEQKENEGVRKSPRLKARVSIAPFFQNMNEGSLPASPVVAKKARDSIAPFFNSMNEEESLSGSPAVRREITAGFFEDLKNDKETRKPEMKKRDSTAGFFDFAHEEEEADLKNDKETRKPEMKKRDSTAGFFDFAHKEEEADLKRDGEGRKADMKKRDSIAGFFDYAHEEADLIEPSMDLGAEESFQTTESDIMLDNTASILSGNRSANMLDRTMDMDITTASIPAIVQESFSVDIDITTSTIPVIAQESFDMDISGASRIMSAVDTPGDRESFSLSMMVDDDSSEEEDDDCMQLDTFHGKDFERLKAAELKREAAKSPFSVGQSDIENTEFDMRVKDGGAVQEEEEEVAPVVHQLTPRKAPVKNNASLSNRSIRNYGGLFFLFSYTRRKIVD
jgi:hypothetical protein